MTRTSQHSLVLLTRTGTCDACDGAPVLLGLVPLVDDQCRMPAMLNTSPRIEHRVVQSDLALGILSPAQLRVRVAGRATLC